MLNFRNFALLALLCLISVNLSAQCGITVDAGPDLLVCGRQVPVRLQGSVSDNAFGFEWIADPSLVDSESENPDAYPSTTTTYTMVGYTAEVEDNLILNHDFEMGNFGFDSDYTYAPGTGANPIGPGSTYVIGDETQPTTTTFTQCFDHSGVSGGMAMYCNGSIQQNERVWCQIVPIVPNTNYVLRAWITAIWDVGAAELQFSVNGDVVGPIFFPDIQNVCTWDLFDERWSSTAGETSAEICIVNQTTIYRGYNFGIDDLFFAPVCEQYDEVTVTVIDTTLDLRSQYFLPCNAPAAGYAINTGTTPSGGGYSHRWTTTDGNIVSGADQLQVRINQTGTYTLEMTYTQDGNTCTNSRDVLVSPSPLTPISVLTSEGDLSCNRSRTELSAEESTTPNGTLYFWNTTDGVIDGPRNTREIDVTAAGTYTITIISPGGCSVADTIIVGEDFSAPALSVTNPAPITCAMPQVTLDATPSSITPGDGLQWSTSGGTIVAGATTLTPTVSRAGTYLLTATNPVNGCTTTASVIVSGSSDPAVARVASPGAINCQGDPVSLSGAGSSSALGTEYLWTTPDGFLTGPANQVTATAGAAGTYQLRVIRPNGCRDSMSVNVIQEGFNPTISFDPTELITCDRAQTDLSATVPTSVPVDYLWMTTDGNIISGASTLNPVVDAAGTYLLTVTERGAGCAVSRTVTVTADIATPAVMASASSDIDCTTTTAELSSVGTGTDPSLELTWTGPGGPVTGTTVTEAGTYRLTVVDPDNGCSAFAEVNIAVDTLRPALDVSASNSELTCLDPETVLGSAATEPNVVYSWSGAPASGIADTDVPQITGTEAGRYVLTATNSSNGCVATGFVDITSDQVDPDVDLAAPTAILNCDVTEMSLVGTVTDGAGFDVAWTTTGNIISGADGLTPLIDQPGSYTLSVTNPFTGCNTTRAVTVTQDIAAPTAEIAPAPMLNCLTPSTTLDAGASSSGANIVFEWTTVGGELLDPATQRNMRVDAAGRYLLTVSNTANGCSSSDLVDITLDTLSPTANVDASTPELTCLETNTTLGTTSAEANVTYQWSGPPTTGLPDLTTPQISGSQPGRYTLTATNGVNGCVTTNFIEITSDQELPDIDLAEPSGILTCDLTEINLAGTITETGDFNVSWTTTGNIITGADGLTPTIDQPGTYTMRVTNPISNCSDTRMVTVSQDVVAPTAAIAPAETLTCQETTTVLEGNGSTTGAAIGYEWSTLGGRFVGSPTEADVSVDAAGTYTLRVTDATNGCFEEATVVVTEDGDRPVVNLDPTATLNCLITDRTLNEGAVADPGLTYEWTSPDAGGGPTVTDQPELEITGPGLYTLAVSDPSNGCVTRRTVQVSLDDESPAIAIAPTDDLNCAVTSLTLDGSASVLNRPTINEWRTISGNFIAGTDVLETTIDAPGTYELKITYPDNGCADSLTVTVGLDTVRPEAILPQPEVLTCVTTSVTASLDAVGSRSYVYDWSTVGGSLPAVTDQSAIVVSAPGTYSVLVRDEINQCEGSAEVIVDQDVLTPEVQALPAPTLTCLDEEVTVASTLVAGRPGPAFEWRNSSGQDLGFADQSELPVTQPGQYFLRVVDPINGCFDEASWEVLQDRDDPVVELAPEIDLGCEDAPFPIAATVAEPGDYTFRWSTTAGDIVSGADALAAVIDGPAVYTLRVGNPANGCSTEVSVLALQTLLDSFAYTLAAPGCDRDLGAISFGEVSGGVAPYVYSIDDGAEFDTQTQFGELAPGAYTLRVQDVRGCEAATSLTIDEARLLEIDAPETIVLNLGDSALINVASNFLPSEIDTMIWSPAFGLSCADCPNPTAKPMKSTTYTVTVQTLNGCQALSRVQVIVDERIGVYFPTGFSPNGDGINDVYAPLADMDRVIAIREMQIYDRWGNQIYETTDMPADGSAGGWDGTLRDKPLNTGVYIYSASVEFFGGRVEQFGGEVVLMR